MSVKHDLVRAHPVWKSARRFLERLFEVGIRKRLDLPAPVADQVMVVPVARVRGLEAGDPVAELDPLGKPELDELVESAIDARNPDAPAPVLDAVVDLLRRAAAGLRAQMLDDGSAGSSVTESSRLQIVECAGAPGRMGRAHG
jgi:hypothetical protein